MKTYICLLRAINVGGNNIIKMKDLILALESLGLESIQTYLQSGNVVFKTNEKNIQDLEKKTEELIVKKFNLSIKVFIYSKEDWIQISGDNPFSGKDNRFQYITFVEKEVKKEHLESIKEKLLDDDILINRGRILYFYFPNGYGTTKINNQFLEKSMKMLTTTRNRNTIDKIRELVTD